MKHRLMFTAFLCVAALAAAPALATEPFCITFEGIDSGGANPSCASEASEGLEYHHLMAREVTNGLPGPLQHHQIIITKRWDQGDSLLWQRLDTGAAIPQVTLEFVGLGGGGSRANFIIRLTNARVLAVEPLIHHVNDPDSINYRDQNRIRLDYQTIGIEYAGADEVVLQSNQNPH